MPKSSANVYRSWHFLLNSSEKPEKSQLVMFSTKSGL